MTGHGETSGPLLGGPDVHHVAISTTAFGRLRAFYVETLGQPDVGGFPDLAMHRGILVR